MQSTTVPNLKDQRVGDFETIFIHISTKVVDLLNRYRSLWWCFLTWKTKCIKTQIIKRKKRIIEKYILSERTGQLVRQ